MGETDKPRLVSPKEAATMTTLSTVHLANMATQGRFPNPVRVSDKRVAYVREEVEAWIEARIAGRKAE
ncbi:putative transcriptional regulator [Agrobacterium sp. DSM 25558]|uniref:helix-turn-helix transcriptional regulator n=1 Tax=Agrobacterium sp. DSM 25558 TaxID=1907665 RepID=UPI0009726102|nr:AlpA family phage regulatory protein [Agrobacterium sp. DSM 25558]SCX29428.1 putative transcriptional regulator [Agrobacterium sp. DSM 25558]